MVDLQELARSTSSDGSDLKCYGFQFIRSKQLTNMYLLFEYKKYPSRCASAADVVCRDIDVFGAQTVLRNIS